MPSLLASPMRQCGLFAPQNSHGGGRLPLFPHLLPPVGQSVLRGRCPSCIGCQVLSSWEASTPEGPGWPLAAAPPPTSESLRSGLLAASLHSGRGIHALSTQEAEQAAEGDTAVHLRPVQSSLVNFEELHLEGRAFKKNNALIRNFQKILMDMRIRFLGLAYE